MIEYKISSILDYMSGNQGLTNEVIHSEKSNLNGIDDIEVLSSSVDKSFSMGFVSKSLHLNNKPLKIFEDKEGILVSRNGNAGILTYLPKGKYTMNDHAYILFIKPELNNFIDTFYLSLQLQDESLKFLSTRDGNKNWNITKFMNNARVYIPTSYDGKFDLKKQRELANIYKTIDEQKNNLLNKCYILKDVSIQLNKVSNVSYKDVPLLTLFTLKGGRMDLSKAYCNINKGSYPVYSGTKNNIEFGNINTYDYDGSYLTWIIDGLAGYLQLVSGKFSITCHKGIFLPTANCNNIDLDYIKYVLEPIFRTIKRGRLGEQGKNEYTALKPKHIEMNNPVIPIPIKSDGTFDLEKQKEIANKYRQIDEIKQGLIEKIKTLVEIKIIPN